MESIDYKKVLGFYKGKTVFVTGNTGFKGSWLTKILLNAGADVIGYALEPLIKPNLYTLGISKNETGLCQIYDDIRDLNALKKAFSKSKPDIVFHLAAQPIVRDSYKKPVYTYETNVMGTVNVCECVRLSTVPYGNGGLKSNDWSGVKSFLNVTTDKVYKNFEWEYGYREDDPLDGYDPYSNSKSCSELVTHSYVSSFYESEGIAVSTARAGNVIGGGDFSIDRIIPDCVRKVMSACENGSRNAEIIVRNPYSIRPYQHVLEPLFMYLTIAMKQYQNKKYEGYYNVGPDDGNCVATGDLVGLFCRKWQEIGRQPIASWKNVAEKDPPYEASFLKLDCSRIKSTFGWKPMWQIDKAIEETVRWTKVWIDAGDVAKEMDREIGEYIAV